MGKWGKRKWEERIGEWWKSKKAEKRKYIKGEIGIHIWICFLDGEMEKMEMGKQDGGMVAY